MEETRRRLRETKRGVVEIALDVGCDNPSHFAQLFMSLNFGYGPAGDKQEEKCHFATSWKRTMAP